MSGDEHQAQEPPPQLRHQQPHNPTARPALSTPGSSRHLPGAAPTLLLPLTTRPFFLTDICIRTKKCPPAPEAMETTSSTPASVTPQWDVFPQKTLDSIDIAVLVLYFVFVLAVGLWVSRHR